MSDVNLTDEEIERIESDPYLSVDDVRDHRRQQRENDPSEVPA